MLESVFAISVIFSSLVGVYPSLIPAFPDPLVSSFTQQNLDKNQNLEIRVFQRHLEAWIGNQKKLKTWTSTEQMLKIDSTFLYDFDHDNNQELIVLFWRYGDFVGKRSYLTSIQGDFKPSQHINIYSLKPQIRLLWGGSTMAKPITDFHICEPYLCATESSYANFPNGNRHIKIIWKSWWWEVEDL